jgi:serine/threonine-protein kinase
MGSPSFMAPEQLVSSKRVDERADIYSIGAVLYFLLTGRPPYDAEQLPALCLKVLNEDPMPPSMHRPDLPREIDDIILTCMAREAASRYPNVVELAYALLPFAPEHSRPLAEAAAVALHLAPGSWRPPGRMVSTGAVTVSVRKPEPSGDAYATPLVGFSSGGASAESTRSTWRRRAIGLAGAACLGLGIGAAVLLMQRDDPPAMSGSAAREAAAIAPETTPATPPVATASPAAAMSPSADRAPAEEAADRAGGEPAGAEAAGGEAAGGEPAGADTAPAEKAAPGTAPGTAAAEEAPSPSSSSPSVAAASGNRDTQLEERRRTRRQRARARARARHRRDAQMTPAAPEAATTPDDPASEPDGDNAVKAAPCSKDDPLCAFGTAR